MTRRFQTSQSAPVPPACVVHADGAYIRLNARIVLVHETCPEQPAHEGVQRGFDVHSLCGLITDAERRAGWRLCGTLHDDPRPVTCQRCVLTGKICAHCGQPITRRQSCMVLPDGRWQHLSACW